MADVELVSPEAARALLEAGYCYVDVQSQEEFERGHVPGALNVPISHQGPQGFVPNPEFLSVMQAAFGTAERLVVGCRTGNRSRRAVELLRPAGYHCLCEMRAGLDGSRDAFGRVTPGWKAKGLPLEMGNPQGQRYGDVRQRKPQRVDDPAGIGERTRA